VTSSVDMATRASKWNRWERPTIFSVNMQVELINCQNCLHAGYIYK
jgi:hypothetical protein